jgi:hypothetical protein
VQHDALITGGVFSVLGGILMLISIIMVIVYVNSTSLMALDLVKVDVVFALAPAISFVGTAILVLSAVSVYRTFRPGKARSGAPLVETVLSIAVSLMVIVMVLMIQDRYQGQDAAYGMGAFLDVIGAILVITGSLLIMLASRKGSKAARSATGFSALAERSGRPSQAWEPPESSIKKPRCPSCQGEMEPGWKACPACGYALIEDDLEDQGRL